MRRLDVASMCGIVSLLVLALPASGQSSRSRATRPESFDFGRRPVTAYERTDGKPPVLKRPDFFCSTCAAEGRIPAGSRREMVDDLTVTRTHPPALGLPVERFGKPRMAQEKVEHVLRFVRDELGHERAVYIEDHHFKIIAAMKGATVRERWNWRHANEMTRLAEIFPEVGSSTSRLDTHRRAHLYLIRARRVLAEMTHLLGFDLADEDLRWRGPFFGMKDKFELYLLPQTRDVNRLLRDFMNIDTPIVEGIWWHLLRDDAMAIVVHDEKGRDWHTNATFTYRMAGGLLQAYRGHAYDLPAWFVLGFAHLMEKRERTDFNTFAVGPGIVPSPFSASDWKKRAKKDIKTGSYPVLKRWSASGSIASVAFPARPAAWSLVTYLLKRDRNAFRRFVRGMKTRAADESLTDVQERALRDAFGAGLDEIERDWLRWAEKW